MNAEQPPLAGRSPMAPPTSVGPSYCLIFTTVLLVYLVSAAPGVLWQDSGLAQVRVRRRDLVGDLGLALAHPLYYVTAFGFQALPFVESAYKTNLVSAVFGAVSVANVFALLCGLTGCRKAATVGALSLAVAHTFWQHCALAEVYTLSTALLTTELLCLLRYERTGRERWLVLLFLVNGLGISNHMLASLSLACYGVLAIWLTATRHVRPRVLPLSVLAWGAGAGLYVGLIVARIAAGDGVEATIRSALFGKYAAGSVNDLVPTGRQLVNSVLYLGMNFPTPAVLLFLPGFAALRSLESRRFGAVLVALLAVHLGWAVHYDVTDQYTFFIPAVVLLSVVIGLGADRFMKHHSRSWGVVLVAGAMLPAAVYAVLPDMARTMNLNLGVARRVPYREEYVYFLQPWKYGYDGAKRFAEEAHAALPEGTVLWADTTTAPPIHYLQLTGRWTKDIRVYPTIEMTAADKAAFTEGALRQDLAAGRVYVVSPQRAPPWIRDYYELVQEGIVYRVVAGHRPDDPG